MARTAMGLVHDAMEVVTASFLPAAPFTRLHYDNLYSLRCRAVQIEHADPATRVYCLPGLVFTFTEATLAHEVVAYIVGSSPVMAH